MVEYTSAATEKIRFEEKTPVVEKIVVADIKPEPSKAPVAEPAPVKSNFTNKNSNYAFSLINQGLTTGEILHKLLEIIGKNYKMPKIWLQNLIKNYIKNIKSSK